MNIDHTRALRFAVGHFSLSLVIGFLCSLYFFGAGLSDNYNRDPAWVVILLATLWILQLPAAAFEALMIHAKHRVGLFPLLIMAFLWSVVIATYLLVWFKGENIWSEEKLSRSISTPIRFKIRMPTLRIRQSHHDHYYISARPIPRDELRKSLPHQYRLNTAFVIT